jgi:toxin FitB
VTAYLLDTNVLSELVRPKPSPEVRAFLQNDADLWLSVITLHELSFGAEASPSPKRKIELLAWIRDITAQFGPRIIALDTATAEHSGRLRALADASGGPSDPLDALIAATAMQRGLVVATRNTKHFKVFGVGLHNPWPAT